MNRVKIQGSYRNPWGWGPESYSIQKDPEFYRGFMIYVREEKYGNVWDVVMNGICVAQLAGPSGAKHQIDRFHKAGWAKEEV